MQQALLASCLVFGLAAPASTEERPALSAVDRAAADLEKLEDMLDDAKVPNADILSRLDAIVLAARTLHVPLVGNPARAKAEQARQRRAQAKRLTALKDDVLELVLEALLETDLDREGANTREAVNRRAASLLPDAMSIVQPEAKARFSRRIIRKIKRMERARHDVHVDVFAGAFLALARLDEVRSLLWLMDNYLHARKQPEEVARLRAGLRGMRAFRTIPGTIRHELVDAMSKRYLAMESLAQQSTSDVTAIAAKRFWDAVRVDVIPLIQYVAGYPVSKSGAALATMAAFEDWFREHDNPHEAPWTEVLVDHSAH